MTSLSVREFRNQSGDTLRRVRAGERFTITSNGEPVAELTPVDRAARPLRWAPIAEVRELLVGARSDPALREELAGLREQTTDHLPY